MLNTHLTYRADIDGLRAIAVLSVVGYHAFPGWIMGGFIGVDIFFVISGFLISTIVINNVINNSFSFIDFYSRRIKRIFPALILVLTFCAVFGWFFLLSNEYEQLGKHIFFSSVFSSNLVLWNESGYFDTLAETKPLLHLWSLGIEEQFYILWPFIVFVCWRIKLNIGWLITTILLISLVFCIWLTYNDTVAAFYSPLTRFWELLIGTLLAFFVLHSKIDIYKKECNLLSGIGLLVIFIGVFSISKKDLFPGWIALVPTIGATIVIFAGSTAWINKKILSNKVMVWFGLISFPIYLWHWPILSFMRIIEGGKPSIFMRIIAVFTTILLAWLTFIFVENPIRFRSRTKLTLLILMILMFLIGMFGLYVQTNKGFQDRTVLKQLTLNQYVIQQMTGSGWQYASNEYCSNTYLSKEAESVFHLWNFCIKNSLSEPTVLLLGNSYANQIYPGFIKNKLLQQHTVLSIGDFNASGFEPKIPERASFIEHERILINGIIENSPSIKYVVISGLDEVPDDLYIKNLINRIDLIERSGKIVIIFTPHLKPPYHPKSCFSRPYVRQTKNCDFGIEVREQQLKNFQPLIDVVRKSNPNVLFYDQTELFCNGTKCSYIKDGLPLHRDESHLSEYGSIKLSELFVIWLEKNIPSFISEN